MFSLKSQIENILINSVRTALPGRQAVECKALKEFKVYHCNSKDKPQFHYYTDLAHLIWKYHNEQVSSNDSENYYGLASAKGLATDIVIMMNQGDNQVFEFVEVGNLTSKDGVEVSIDFKIKEEALRNRENVFIKILQSESLGFEIPLISSKLKCFNMLERSKNIEGFTREYLRIKHAIKMFNNISEIFKEYTENEDILQLKFNSQYSESKIDNCIYFSDYLDNYTDKECKTEQIIEEWMKNIETFKRMNACNRPIKCFNFTASGITEFKQSLISNAFKGTSLSNQTYLINKAYDIMLDLASKPLSCESGYNDLFKIYDEIKYISKENKSKNHNIICETLRNVFSLDTASVK